MRTSTMAILTAALVPASFTPASGPEWEEGSASGGDAGSLPGDAEVTVGSGPIARINGSLNGAGLVGGDFQDMYLVRIDDPESFSLSTESTMTSFNTQLWLFNFDERGQLANDDIAPLNFASAFGNAANDGSGFVVNTPGLYYVAVSGSDSDPLGGTPFLPIFNQVSPFEISGPDGPGGTLPVTAWSAEGETGTYQIHLTGCSFAAVCEGDLDGNGVVDTVDLLLLLALWGTDPGGQPDFDGNGTVDADDLVVLIGNWGACFPT